MMKVHEFEISGASETRINLMKKWEKDAMTDHEKAQETVTKAEQELRKAQRDLSCYLEGDNGDPTKQQEEGDDTVLDDESDNDCTILDVANEPLSFTSIKSTYKHKSCVGSDSDCSDEDDVSDGSNNGNLSNNEFSQDDGSDGSNNGNLSDNEFP